MIESSNFLTIKEAARLLRVNKITLYRHIKNGTIAVIKIGKAIRINKAELLKSTIFKSPVDKKEIKTAGKKSYVLKANDPLYLLSKNTSK